jgi:hypothetical protein
MSLIEAVEGENRSVYYANPPQKRLWKLLSKAIIHKN